MTTHPQHVPNLDARGGGVALRVHLDAHALVRSLLEHNAKRQGHRESEL